MNTVRMTNDYNHFQAFNICNLFWASDVGKHLKCFLTDKEHFLSDQLVFGMQNIDKYSRSIKKKAFSVWNHQGKTLKRKHCVWIME